MKHFLTGLLLGLAAMYGYVHYKDAVVLQVNDWFVEASRNPDAPENLDRMFPPRR